MQNIGSRRSQGKSTFWQLLSIYQVPGIDLHAGNTTKRNPPGGSEVKNLPAAQEAQETRVWSLDREDPLEKGMTTHSSIPAQRIP